MFMVFLILNCPSQTAVLKSGKHSNGDIELDSFMNIYQQNEYSWKVRFPSLLYFLKLLQRRDGKTSVFGFTFNDHPH